MAPRVTRKWEKSFKTWLRQNETCSLYKSRKHKLTSEPGETEGAFRTRLQQLLSEKRDQAIAKLRNRFASKATTLENRLLRAEQKIESEEQLSTQRKLDTVVSFGTAILGAVLGRKRISSSTTSKVGTAMKRASAARKKSGDVERARETAEKVRQDLETLNETLQTEIDAMQGLLRRAVRGAERNRHQAESDRHPGGCFRAGLDAVSFRRRRPFTARVETAAGLQPDSYWPRQAPAYASRTPALSSWHWLS